MLREKVKENKEIIVDLETIVKKRNKSVYELSKETGIRYHIIKKYYQNEVYRVDLEVLKKLCIALECMPSDIIKLIKMD